MAILTGPAIRQVVRQPAVWVDPCSYAASIKPDFEPAITATIQQILPLRGYPNDRLKIATSDTASPLAVSYSENATIALADTPYIPATAPPDVREVTFKLVSVSYELPTNLEADLLGDQWAPEDFENTALVNGVRGREEYLLINGDSSLAGNLEFDGFLSPNFPRMTVATGGNFLNSLDAAIDEIQSGCGTWKADYILCHQRVARSIQQALRAQGVTPPQIEVKPLGRYVMAYPSAQGHIPVVVSNFFPIANDDTSSVIIVHTSNPRGVHLAVPERQPNIRITTERIDNRPAFTIIAEFKSALATIDARKTVELTGAPAAL